MPAGGTGCASTARPPVEGRGFCWLDRPAGYRSFPFVQICAAQTNVFGWLPQPTAIPVGTHMRSTLTEAKRLMRSQIETKLTPAAACAAVQACPLLAELAANVGTGN